MTTKCFTFDLDPLITEVVQGIANKLHVLSLGAVAQAQ
jgi:hypothetical protein